MTFTRADVDARVARGAAGLDLARPGWFNQIDTGTLSIGSCVDCILGQLFRYDEAGDEMELPFGDGLKSLGWWNSAGEHGVGGFENGDHIQYAQDAWIAAIAARKFPVLEPAPPLDAPLASAMTTEHEETEGLTRRSSTGQRHEASTASAVRVRA